MRASFTEEEKMLIGGFGARTRRETVRNLVLIASGGDDPEMASLARSAVSKLMRMSDREFLEADLDSAIL
ncbi:MAG: transposon-transfer assisting family protein [Oscillospiraceae bacterium]|jgi:hypothetical protein